MVIKIKMSLSHNSPQGEDFLGLNKSAVADDTAHQVSAEPGLTPPGLRDHILLEVGLT